MYQKQCRIIRAKEDGEDLEVGAGKDMREVAKLGVIVDVDEREKLGEQNGTEPISSSRSTT
jgi:hypothetical protein